MEIDNFLDWASKLRSRKGKKGELERLKKYFERFYLLNRSYLDKEAFEKAQGSLSSMAEAMANILQYLNEEIVRLRNKRMKLPFENVTLGEMQRLQKKNEMLIKEFLESLK